jgi:hypothetical protein
MIALSCKHDSARRHDRFMRMAAFLCVLCLGISCGCDSKKQPGPTTYPVHGKVFFQNKPAVGIRVILNPLKAWAGPQFAPSAITDSNGAFSIASYGKPGDGAPAGEYAVTFVWPKPTAVPAEDSGAAEVDQFQKRYADPKTSSFRATVKEGDNELPPFQLK